MCEPAGMTMPPLGNDGAIAGKNLRQPGPAENANCRYHETNLEC